LSFGLPFNFCIFVLWQKPYTFKVLIMNKLHHLRRALSQTFLGLGIAFFSLISVAHGTSSPLVNQAIDAKETLLSTVDCQAAFYKEVAEGSFADLGGVTFHNYSEGDFTSANWDFGDGTFSSETLKTISHFYNQSGTYEVALTIWDDNYNCSSTTTHEISVTVSTDPCLLSDCVFPGDADTDGKADLNDLMYIGMGFGLTGPEREDPTPLDWIGQPVLDWAETTVDGINYKHFDSDGNGVIDYQDIIPVIQHYSPMEGGLDHTNYNGPKISLDFEVDTIFINEDTEGILTLSAGVIVGSGSKPMEDIYGMSFYFDYDAALTEETEGIVLNYNDNCFFGDANEVIAFGRELRSNQQADLVITRLNGQNTSGYGRVATVNFFIIIDIIDGRAESAVDFNVPISGIKVIDKDGDIIPVSVDPKAAKVVFINESITRVKENPLNNQVSVFPNPATDQINIELTDLTGEYVNIFNSLGQLISTHPFDQTRTHISASDLSRGMYLLNIQTDKGLVSKRIVVE